MIPRQTEIPGRRVPGLVASADWPGAELRRRAVVLPEANTLAHRNFLTGNLGCLVRADGRQRFFNPEMLLVKFAGSALLEVVRVESGLELDAVQAIAARPDVEFVELDLVQYRCFVPDDPLLGNQWQHQKIGSFEAWNVSSGPSPVRVAIVDTPFQMDHPDLVANTVPGWDAVANQPVTNSAGIDHSTLGAGLVAAALNNSQGVAGIANCRVLPINSNGFESELCNAVYWAATNGVRVVNISWTGAGSSALNSAAEYFRTQAHGVVVMSDENGAGDLGLPNQPDIWVVAMTDAADNQRSKYGVAVDFAAPGWAIYSTTTGGGYGFASGASYAAPVLAGVVARLFTINPVLAPEDVQDILASTAQDLGDPGWDMWFGSGRVDFARAAAEARARLPRMTIGSSANNEFAIGSGVKPGFTCQLWQSASGISGPWALLPNAQTSTNENELVFHVPATTGRFFYRVSLGP